ncbi:MAG TPA: HU family DNA-binding protein [Bacillota bacterium]|nr:HU family DNA-binding protein [Bacillota bacterium]
MNKSNLVDVVAAKASIKKKDAEAAVDAVFGALEDELAQGGKVLIAGFGSFKVKERAARMGRNPKTREPIEIPASRSVAFSAGKGLKDAVIK